MKINFNKQGDGLIPAIAQDYKTGKVLMLAYMNEEAFLHTVKTQKGTYWSRSRNKLWVKGESSGNVQNIKEILVDCDEDTVLLKVEQVGDVACHKGYNSCFFRKIENNELQTVEEIIKDPAKMYNK